ncbi:MAG: DUF3892 domain-containing protein [Coriobacteriia bacterium]|nr:DUF3892 domain-containing protein [Coriobacteriia bacterium]
MEGGSRHEHIASVQWRSMVDSSTGTSSRADMVDWIKNKGGKAYVQGNWQNVDVGVVDATPPYLRTYANGIWTDNLLALPEF